MSAKRNMVFATLTEAAHGGPVLSLQRGPSGDMLATTGADGIVSLRTGLEYSSVRQLCCLKSKTPSLSFGQQGTILSTVSEEGDVRTWDVQTGRQIGFHRAGYPLHSAAFSSDGYSIYFAGNATEVIQADPLFCKQPVSLGPHPEKISALACSPVQNTLAVGLQNRAGTIYLWDTTTTLARTAITTSTGAVTGMNVSADGLLLAVSTEDRALHLVDLQEDDCIAALSAIEPIHSPVFSSDSSRIAGVGISGTIWLWDVFTGRQLKGPDSDYGITSISFSSDNKFLILGTLDGSLLTWKVEQALVVYQRGFSSQRLHHSNIGQTSQTDQFITRSQYAYAMETGNPEVLISLSKELIGDIRYLEAKAMSQRAALLAPENPYAHFTLGIASINTGDMEQAEESFLSTLYIDPTFAPACSNLGTLNMQAGEYEVALDFLTCAVKMNPSSPVSLVNLGITLQNLGSIQEAREAFTNAILLDPSYPVSYYQMGLLCIEEQDWEGAAENYLALARFNRALANRLRAFLFDAPESPEDQWLNQYRLGGALLASVLENDIESADRLILMKAPVNYREMEQERTLLMLTAERGSVEILSKLLTAGSEPNDCDKDGITALHLAVRGGFHAEVSILLSMKADARYTDNNWRTPLMDAALVGDIESLSSLMNYDSAPEAQDKNGRTALMLAVINGNAECVRILKACGVNLSVQDSLGDTALSLARKYNRLQIVSLLTASCQKRSNKSLISANL